MDGAGSPDHLRLSVRDPEASAALYDPVLTLLGDEQGSRDDGGRADESGRKQWLHARRHRASGRPELGADVLDAPTEYGDGPGYYAIFFRDPDGFKPEVVHVP